MVTEREKTEAYYEYVKGLMKRCYDAVNEVPGLRDSNGKITFAEFVDVVGRGLVELGVFTQNDVCLKTREVVAVEEETLPQGVNYRFLEYEYDPKTGTITSPDLSFTLQTRLAVPFSAIISKQGRIASHDYIQRNLKETGCSSSREDIRTNVLGIRRKFESWGLPENLFQSVTGRGYRFTAEVTVVQIANPSVQPADRT